MPDYQKDCRRDFSKYDSMTDGELEEILRMDAMKSDEEESDMDMLMYVMGVLAERRRNSANPGKTPEEAYQSFLENYYVEIENTEVAEESTHHTLLPVAKGNRPGWRRILVTAAACFAILLCGVVTSAALDDDIGNTLFDWTKEIFSFSAGDQPNETGPSNEYELVDETWENVLKKKNIPDNLMPVRLLDGYEQEQITFSETPQMRFIHSYFEKGDRTIRMTVTMSLTENPIQIEKTEDFVEIYEFNNIQYFLFSNNNQVQAVWQVDQYECMIVGNLSMEEMKQLIHSIQKG